MIGTFPYHRWHPSYIPNIGRGTVSLHTPRKVDRYEDITGSCKLCYLEIMNIIYSKDNNLLNKRSEINCKCRHRDKFLLNNYLEEDGT